MTNWSATDLAYLAGIIDGEGTISIFESKSVTTRSGKRYEYMQYQARLCVYNNNPALMIWIMDRFGGRGTARPVQRKRKNNNWGINENPLLWKQGYIWECGRRAAVPILEALLPYLVMKKSQAEIYLRFQTTMGTGGRGPKGHRLISEGILSSRKAMMLEVQKLNRGNFDAMETIRRQTAH